MIAELEVPRAPGRPNPFVIPRRLFTPPNQEVLSALRDIGIEEYRCLPSRLVSKRHIYPNLLQHEGNWRLVNKVWLQELPGSQLVAMARCTPNRDLCEGHFGPPQGQITPGVIQVEAFGQSAAAATMAFRLPHLNRQIRREQRISIRLTESCNRVFRISHPGRHVKVYAVCEAPGATLRARGILTQKSAASGQEEVVCVVEAMGCAIAYDPTDPHNPAKQRALRLGRW